MSSPYAALAVESISPYGSTSALIVANMRNGHVAQRGVDNTIADLVLTSRGVAAFILGPPTDGDNNPIGTPRVQTLEPNGTLTELDAGNIDVRSLAVSRDGRHLYWTKDGVAHSTTL